MSQSADDMLEAILQVMTVATIWCNRGVKEVSHVIDAIKQDFFLP